MLKRLFRSIDAKVPPRQLAIARILAGIACLGLAVEVRKEVGPLTNPNYLEVPMWQWMPHLSLNLLNAVVGLWIIASLGLIAGKLARLCAMTLACLGAFIMLVDNQAYSNHLVLMVLLTTMLAFGRPAEALSLKSGKRLRVVPHWPMLLMKVQLTSMYFWTAIAKLNPSFFHDHPLREGSREFVSNALPDSAYVVGGVVMILTELFLAFALWSKRTRVAAMVIGALMHFTIALFGASAVALLPFGVLAVSVYPLFMVEPTFDRRINLAAIETRPPSHWRTRSSAKNLAAK